MSKELFTKEQLDLMKTSTPELDNLWRDKIIDIPFLEKDLARGGRNDWEQMYQTWSRNKGDKYWLLKYKLHTLITRFRISLKHYIISLKNLFF